MKDIAKWLWYANVLGFSAQNAAHTLSLYPSPDALMQSGEYARRVLTPMQYEALYNTSPDMFINKITECKRLSVEILTFDSPLYPPQLKESICSPPVLYYRGDITLLTHSLLFAIIGTRRPSSYGVQATRNIAQTLSENGVVLVSGLATGLDSEAHKAALSREAATVACLAFGHDKCYPAANRTLKELIEKTGLTISEYPPGTDSQKVNFLNRNRIIAALSRGVCVAEARKASGTMNTVTHALDMGRDVFSVPGSIFSPMSEGTNNLLSEGAILCTSGEDILNYYAYDCRKPEKATQSEPLLELSEGALAIFKAISPIAKTAEQLADETGIKTNEAMAALTQLELCGAVRQLSGRRFELADASVILQEPDDDMSEMYF